MKLGKRPAIKDPRTLKYADYRTGSSTAPWRAAHWGHDLPYGMLGNDRYGDCVEASFAHQVQVWLARSGNGPFTITTGDVLADYSAITGFDPRDPRTDQGTSMYYANRYWKGRGLIDAYATVDPLSGDQVRESVAWFGGLNIGVALPVSAQAQTGGVWDVTTGPDAQAGSWGGHCIPVVGYTSRTLWVVTWGALQAMTWNFLRTYCDEAYVFLSKQWIGAAGVSPSNLAWGQLDADLANL
jgi:hypothetical protein